MKLGHESKNAICASISPTTRDLEWAAGFLEGEGCFSRSRHGTINRGSEHVSAAQVNPEPLWKLQEIFGGPISKRIPKIATQKAFWIWQVSGARARGIMMTLFSLLSTVKQAQVLEALGDR